MRGGVCLYQMIFHAPQCILQKNTDVIGFFEGESLRGGTFFPKKSSPSQEKR